MSESAKNIQADGQILDEQLSEIAGGNSIQKRRLEQLSTHDSSKSVKDIQQARLDHLDTNDSSK